MSTPSFFLSKPVHLAIQVSSPLSEGESVNSLPSTLTGSASPYLAYNSTVMLRGLTLSLLSSSSHTFSTWNSTSSVV
jgi:hypothetical protein